MIMTGRSATLDNNSSYHLQALYPLVIMNFSFTVLGFVVALLVAMTGVGGGSLMAPVLILGLHVPPAVAVGTDLLYTAVTRAGALWVYARQGQVRWSLAGQMLAGSLPAAAITLAVLWLVRADARHLDSLTKIGLSIALASSATAILLRERIGGLITRDDAPVNSALRDFMPIGAGALIGVLVSLSSVGAGAIGVTVLLILFPWVNARHLVGTDLAHGVVLALVTGLGHMFVAKVDFPLLGQLLLGTLPGIYVGTKLTGLVSEMTLRRTIAFLLLGVAVKLVV
jgi:uncharacterized protein